MIKKRIKRVVIRVYQEDEKQSKKIIGIISFIICCWLGLVEGLSRMSGLLLLEVLALVLLRRLRRLE